MAGATVAVRRITISRTDRFRFYCFALPDETGKRRLALIDTDFVTDRTLHALYG